VDAVFHRLRARGELHCSNPAHILQGRGAVALEFFDDRKRAVALNNDRRRLFDRRQA
jgi:hypothetical protein